MKVSGDTTCPHCKKDHEAAFDIDKLEVKQHKTPTLENPTTNTQSTIQIQPEVKEVEKIIEVAPHIQPQFNCKSDTCGKPHINKNYKKLPIGKCDNCEQFSGDLSKPCPWCNGKEFVELEHDDLIDLGLPEPPEHDHEE